MLFFLSLAHAAPPSPNAAIDDFDGDGIDDIAIGVPGSCGAIDLRLSSVSPWMRSPANLPPGGTITLPAATLRVSPSRCDPTFGLDVVSAGGLVATLPDARSGASTTGLSLTRTATQPYFTATLVTLATLTSYLPPSEAACTACVGSGPCCVPPSLTKGCSVFACGDNGALIDGTP